MHLVWGWVAAGRSNLIAETKDENVATRDNRRSSGAAEIEDEVRMVVTVMIREAMLLERRE